MNKRKTTEAKKKAKQDKNCEKSQINSIRRLALGNSQLGSFKDVLSDPADIQPPSLFADLMHFANHQTVLKKRAAAIKRANTMEKNCLSQISKTTKAPEYSISQTSLTE